MDKVAPTPQPAHERPPDLCDTSDDECTVGRKTGKQDNPDLLPRKSVQSGAAVKPAAKTPPQASGPKAYLQEAEALYIFAGPERKSTIVEAMNILVAAGAYPGVVKIKWIEIDILRDPINGDMLPEENRGRI